VASRSNTGQRRWIEKVQTRLHITAALLQNMKTIKMLGLTGVVGQFVESLREDEIETSKGFRKLVIWEIFLCMFTFPNLALCKWVSCNCFSQRTTPISWPRSSHSRFSVS
jgi:hypothetical protein